MLFFQDEFQKLASCSDRGIDVQRRESKSDTSTEMASDILSSECGDDDTGFSYSACKTLFIFDWDDTLFATSWADQQGLLGKSAGSPNQMQQALLVILVDRVQQTLTTAMQHGNVVIVTNAVQGWVQKTCHRFMPMLVPLLDQITIISARSLYESCGIYSPAEWKRLAFCNVLDAFCEECQVQSWNVISIGDSIHEQLALESATFDRPECYTKTVKCVEIPKVEQLIEQHELINTCIPDSLIISGNLHLNLAVDSLQGFDVVYAV